MKYLKGELYKLFHNKLIYLTIILSFIYGILVNIIYYINNLSINDLYHNYIDEYFILYFILTIFYVSFTVSDEYDNKTIMNIFKHKFIIIKLLSIVIYLFILFIFSYFVCYDISLFFFKFPVLKIKIIIEILLSFIKIIPLLFTLILLCFNLTLLFKKANISLVLTYVIYFGFVYLDNHLLNINSKIIPYLFTMHLNLNNHYILNNVSFNISILIDILVLFILLLFSFIIFNYQKNK